MTGNVSRVKTEILAGRTTSYLCAVNNLNIKTNSNSERGISSTNKKTQPTKQAAAFSMLWYVF